MVSGENGNGHSTEDIPEKLQQILSQGSFDKQFSQHEMASVVKYLVDPGDSIRKLLMRTNIPSKRKDGHIMVIAAMHHRAKCIEFGDKEAESELMDVIAGFTSVDDTRTQDLVRAIIGDSQQKKSLGLSEKIKKAAGLGE